MRLALFVCVYVHVYVCLSISAHARCIHHISVCLSISQLLPNLAELNLQAYHVTDTALAYFTAKQGYTTHTLRLNSCWEITNHGVVNMVHSLPNLSVLSLSGCSKVTDDGVELVAENLRKLRSLDLSWCPRITDMALEYIACDLHKLEELVLDR
uniref:F-box/LRR-repeat protein 15-like leucin rich repeat domain-containing protein n=1 Tax=Pavo cristatus TaxID=9049 RepID=A0A8C9EQH5_PAVCR